MLGSGPSFISRFMPRMIPKVGGSHVKRSCPMLVSLITVTLSGASTGCSEPVGPCCPVLDIRIVSGPTEVRQGDVASFGAVVTQDGSPSEVSVDWSVEPASAGLMKADGRFVAYRPGNATIVAEAQGSRADSVITIFPRQVPTGTFSVVGHGEVFDRFTSDLWLKDTFAYTGTWGTRNSGAGPFQGNRLYVWNISNPSSPTITDSVVVTAGTVNDVKIRDDGALAVLTHEGSADGLNGITLLDLADPLHPQVISRFTDTLERGVHNVWIDGDFVYAAVDGSSQVSGLRILDVSDPANSSVVADFYGGDQFLHDVYVRDGLAFLSHWDPGLIVLDVGNGISGGSPQNPVEISRVQTVGGDTHNAWYSPESGYVFVGEEDFSTPGKMHVIDARDLANPREVATYAVEGTTPHNFWLDDVNDVLYAAWYDRGIFAIDVSGELLGELHRQGRTIASFTYDGPGSCQSMGTCTWAPQWHAGHLWVSDMNSGLWALRLDF